MRSDALSVTAGIAAVMAVCLPSTSAALSITTVSQATRPYSSTYGAEQISGITYAGGDLYYAVDDNDVKLYPIMLKINRDTGSLASGTNGMSIGTGVVMSGSHDMEGCAFDPASGKVWISQETSALIREFDPATGTLLRSAPVPAVQKQYAGNYSLEALTISGDGMTMWTANEEALKVDIPGHELETMGYAWHSIGGETTCVYLPSIVMEMGCLLPYGGDAYFKCSLAEPISCIVSAFRTNYHHPFGSHVHEMGIENGGTMLLMAGCGAMGLGCIDIACHSPEKRPRRLVVTDIDDARLARAARMFGVTGNGERIPRAEGESRSDALGAKGLCVQKGRCKSNGENNNVERLQ